VKNHGNDTTHRAIEGGRSADILSARAERAAVPRRISWIDLSGLRPLADRMSALRFLDTMQPYAKLVIEGDDLWQAIRKCSRFAQERRQSACRQSQAVCGTDKHCGYFRI